MDRTSRTSKHNAHYDSACTKKGNDICHLLDRAAWKSQLIYIRLDCRFGVTYHAWVFHFAKSSILSIWIIYSYMDKRRSHRFQSEAFVASLIRNLKVWVPFYVLHIPTSYINGAKCCHRTDLYLMDGLCNVISLTTIHHRCKQYSARWYIIYALVLTSTYLVCTKQCQFL